MISDMHRGIGLVSFVFDSCPWFSLVVSIAFPYLAVVFYCFQLLFPYLFLVLTPARVRQYVTKDVKSTQGMDVSTSLVEQSKNN